MRRLDLPLNSSLRTSSYSCCSGPGLDGGCGIDGPGSDVDGLGSDGGYGLVEGPGSDVDGPGSDGGAGGSWSSVDAGCKLPNRGGG
jgi:hypothetical protein